MEKPSDSARPSAPTLRGLDWLNFFLADIQTGVGPFLAIYLAGYKWNEQSVGLALTVGGIAGILMQTPAGALVDRSRSKRALIAAGICRTGGRRIADCFRAGLLVRDVGPGYDWRHIEHLRSGHLRRFARDRGTPFVRSPSGA